MTTPSQRNTNANKADLREGRIPLNWQDKLLKPSDKDGHARRTLKFTMAKPQDDRMVPSTDFAILFFGYKSYVSIDRKFRLTRKYNAMDAAVSGGARLCEGLLNHSNKAYLS